ncbi:MAG: YhfC family glutamic-type intramembrane protease [Limisphaerales bacterium]
MSKSGFCLGVFAAVMSIATLAARAELLEAKGRFELGQTNAHVRSFSFGGGKMVISLGIDTHPGTVTVEVRSPSGAPLGTQTGGVLTMDWWKVASAERGAYTLLVKPNKTAGTWRVRIDALPPSQLLYQQVVSGGMMMLVALAAVAWWKLHSRVAWRWFWAGAGIWTVGVALKFALAVPLNPFFVGTAAHGPRLGLAGGVIYCGLMTGIFEIGVTLAAALVWRRMAAEPERAVAVGLGAGAFEALLLGLGAAVGCLVALVSGQGDRVLQALAPTAAATPLLWLAGPVERLIAISAHTAARVCVLQAAARRGWLGFWVGFAWLSAVDLLAGVALLTGMTKSSSIWWMELMILPFGILSLPLARYAICRWPKVTVPEATPMTVQTL